MNKNLVDFFGIGVALRAMISIYITTARGSGRTTMLLESLRDGDRVCCATLKEADRLRRICNLTKLKVTFTVVNPADPFKLFNSGSSVGRTIFDHTWVEKFYILAIEGAAETIAKLQKESSGYGADHERTKSQAIELSKWGYPEVEP